MTVVGAEPRRSQNSEVDIEAERAMSTERDRVALRLGRSAEYTEMGLAEVTARGPGCVGRGLNHYFLLLRIELDCDWNSYRADFLIAKIAHRIYCG